MSVNLKFDHLTHTAPYLSQEAQKMFDISQHPGAENLGDFPSKAHPAAVMRHIRPYVLQMDDSPLVLARAPSPKSRRGCAETLGSPYRRGLPLPRIPRSHDSRTDDGQTMAGKARPRARLARLMQEQAQIIRGAE